ncbi:MAG: transposase [Muribaculum sp.]|nr:transposase [Muribaculum sp.]
MDTYPVTARTVGRSYGIEGDKLGRAYKDHLSDFRTWDQAEHADEWMLLAENVGKRMSIDETQLHDDLFTILSNKDGHGGPGTVAAVAAGTSAEEVLKTLLQIPEETRLGVEEITMDFSESMRSISESAFPNATRVIDCFHVMKRLSDALEEMRLKEKRLAVAEQKRLERQHAKNSSAMRSIENGTARHIRRITRGRSVGESPSGTTSDSRPRLSPMATPASNC